MILIKHFCVTLHVCLFVCGFSPSIYQRVRNITFVSSAKRNFWYCEIINKWVMSSAIESRRTTENICTSRWHRMRDPNTNGKLSLNCIRLRFILSFVRKQLADDGAIIIDFKVFFFKLIKLPLFAANLHVYENADARNELAKIVEWQWIMRWTSILLTAGHLTPSKWPHTRLQRRTKIFLLGHLQVPRICCPLGRH